MNKQTAAKIAYLRRENLKWPDTLIAVPRSEWPDPLQGERATRIGVLRSRTFLVQIFREAGGCRLSVVRTMIDQHGGWLQSITWDELQEVKRQAAFGYLAFVEIYPADSNIINVANMRHLWLIPPGVKLGWMDKANGDEIEAPPMFGGPAQ